MEEEIEELEEDVMGDLEIEGVHPGDPYDALVLLYRHLKFRPPTPAEAPIWR